MTRAASEACAAGAATELRWTVPEAYACDVLVIGGGSAGASAAVAAADEGADVVLVERYGFLGGTGAMVLDTCYGFFTPGSVEKKVVGGVPDRVVAGLERRGVLLKRPNTYGAGARLTYDPDTLKLVWDELTHDAGCACCTTASSSTSCRKEAA